jgi:hypothetical protein
MKNGYSKPTIRQNIADLMREGFPQAQATAAALNKARACYYKRYPQGFPPAWLRAPKSKGRESNPVPQSKLAATQDGITLFKRFRGEEPEYIDKVKIHRHDVCIVIGECDGILYSTVRDGEPEKYIHRFKKKSRPLLCSSSDGSQLYLIGGSYDFTDVGITDR